MRKLVLIFIGMLTALYGILVLQVGSGTLFWLVWEAIALFFILWAILVHKNFFMYHKKFKIIFHTLLMIGVAVLAIFCGMIAGEFTAKGKTNLDYIIVLGAQVRETGPSVVLRYRLDAAVDYMNQNPSTICIVSGGQGINEPFSEAEGMYRYLIEKGIEENRIILEDKSTNTVENIQNSKVFRGQSHNGVGIVTNNFHVFRAVQIAKTQGIKDVHGIAAESNNLYLPNNVLRECCGILKDFVLGNI